MDNSVKFSCVLENTDPLCPLGLEIWLDDQQIFNDNHVSALIHFEHDILEKEGDHQLKFVIKNKTPEHTKIDESGQIIKDAKLVVKDLCFDQIKIDQVVSDLAVYTHDFNGTGNLTHGKFYSELGCNGVVSLNFTTPVYLWLLENT
jgi:hypothetical protein